MSIALLVYTCTYGFYVKVPRLDDRMKESIRNFFFHVPMWFTMMILLLVSMIYSIRYLRNPIPKNDAYAVAFASTGVFYGLLGLVTGAIWSNYQWGSPWSGDPKQNGAAIAMLIYLAYFVLRGSLNEDDKKGRIVSQRV